ncbi:MAG: glycosyltransferase family 2 protein [Acidimicrobiales bacterium]
MGGPAGRDSVTPDVAVVVATQNRSRLLPRLVGCLESQTMPKDRFEVVVADNASTDATPEVLETLCSTTSVRLRAVRLETNRGPAAARNAAWRASGAPVVACTDDDCQPEPTWLEAGIRALAHDPNIGVVQGRTEHPVDAGSYRWTDWTVARQVREPTPWFEGCNLFFRRDALDAVGGFDEALGWIGEETSLGWGILAGGWWRAFADDAVVRHDLGERGFRWHLRARYLEWHHVRTARRYPDFHATFWRPWAMHRFDAEFALAALGALLGLRWRSGLVLALPYARRRLPRPGHPRFVRLCCERIAVDAAALAGKLVASVRFRRLVV